TQGKTGSTPTLVAEWLTATPCAKRMVLFDSLPQAGRICAAPILSTRTVRPLIGWSRMATLDVHELEPLVRRAQAKAGQAFAKLLARCRRYLHAQVRKQLGAGADGPIDASALVQSVCRKVLVHFHELEGPTVPRLLCWIGVIVRNRVND